MKIFNGFEKIGEMNYKNWTMYMDIMGNGKTVQIIETTYFDRKYDRVIEKFYNFRQWAQLAPLVKYDIKLISK